MPKFFDEAKWTEKIKEPDWYIELESDIAEIKKLIEDKRNENREEVKEELYSFFENALEKEIIPLPSESRDWDDARKPIDTIVIHHSSMQPNLILSRLNAMHFINLYVPYHLNPGKDDIDVKGKPIYSGHFMNNKQVFYAYHWLIRMDGKKIRLLDDKYLGWHAGNWDMNCRSIAMCLDNDYEKIEPDNTVLQYIVELIQENYPHIKPEMVIGHIEANPNTICPGEGFLGESGWKKKLLDLLS